MELFESELPEVAGNLRVRLPRAGVHVQLEAVLCRQVRLQVTVVWGSVALRAENCG